MASFDSRDSAPSETAPPERPHADDAAPIARRKREAEEWALVLTAEGLAPTVVRAEAGWTVEVEADRRAEAWRSIEAWRRERAERARRVGAREATPPPETRPIETAAAYALALALLAFHVGLALSGRREALVDAGASRAALVVDGELWRVLTALTLHADAGHVAGNTLFGGFFLAALAGRLGLGCGALAFVLTGALGNLANALYYSAGHVSIGASTGVFGLVGVLAGLAAWRRHQSAPPGRGAWVAFAAGLAVVAMLGSGGPGIDFSAHLFGLAAGGLAGFGLAIPLAGRPPPPRPVQVGALLLSFVMLAGAWRIALQARGIALAG